MKGKSPQYLVNNQQGDGPNRNDCRQRRPGEKCKEKGQPFYSAFKIDNQVFKILNIKSCTTDVQPQKRPVNKENKANNYCKPCSNQDPHIPGN